MNGRERPGPQTAVCACGRIVPVIAADGTLAAHSPAGDPYATCPHLWPRRTLETMGPAPAIHGGTSTCPICGVHWWVTPLVDCLVPACGCYGDDTSANNRERPCHACGLAHALECRATLTDPGCAR